MIFKGAKVFLISLMACALSAPVMADSLGECESVIREGNEAMAYKHCLAAAQEGNPKAQILVGVALMNGVGVSKNPDSAAGWFKRSADQMYPAGMYYLAMAKISGLGTAQDETDGMLLMRKAAASGEPRAKDFLVQIGEAPPAVKSNEVPLKRKRFVCEGIGCGKPIDGIPR